MRHPMWDLFPTGFFTGPVKERNMKALWTLLTFPLKQHGRVELTHQLTIIWNEKMKWSIGFIAEGNFGQTQSRETFSHPIGFLVHIKPYNTKEEASRTNKCGNSIWFNTVPLKIKGKSVLGWEPSLHDTYMHHANSVLMRRQIVALNMPENQIARQI